MGWRNSKPDEALLSFLEDDMASVASARSDALKELEALALRAAQAGLLDADDAGRAGRALRQCREALDTIHKWLVLFRASRPGEIIMVEMDVGLLVEVPPRPDSTWLSGIVRRFQALHEQTPRSLAIPSGAHLPNVLRQAVESEQLALVECQPDEGLRPGRARLIV